MNFDLPPTKAIKLISTFPPLAEIRWNQWKRWKLVSPRIFFKRTTVVLPLPPRLHFKLPNICRSAFRFTCELVSPLISFVASIWIFLFTISLIHSMLSRAFVFQLESWAVAGGLRLLHLIKGQVWDIEEGGQLPHRQPSNTIRNTLCCAPRTFPHFLSTPATVYPSCTKLDCGT